jgi:hypothetical protein
MQDRLGEAAIEAPIAGNSELNQNSSRRLELFPVDGIMALATRLRFGVSPLLSQASSSFLQRSLIGFFGRARNPSGLYSTDLIAFREGRPSFLNGRAD